MNKKEKILKEDFEELVVSLYKLPLVGLFGEEVAEYLWKRMNDSILCMKINSKGDYIAGYMMGVLDAMSPENEKFDTMLDVRNKAKKE